MLKLLLDHYYPDYAELETLYEVAEPMLYSLQVNGKQHLIYVMQNRTILTEKGLATMYEVFLGESTTENIANLRATRTSILDALNNTENKQRIGVINNKVYPPKKIKDMAMVQHRLPQPNVNLECMWMPGPIELR